jgi:cysteinyl-tRNA synthetase
MITWDLLKRLLEYKRIPYLDAMSITDIDDKIILQAAQQKVRYSLISQNFESRFFEDMHRLNVLLTTLWSI